MTKMKRIQVIDRHAYSAWEKIENIDNALKEAGIEASYLVTSIQSAAMSSGISPHEAVNPRRWNTEEKYGHNKYEPNAGAETLDRIREKGIDFEVVDSEIGSQRYFNSGQPFES